MSVAINVLVGETRGKDHVVVALLIIVNIIIVIIIIIIVLDVSSLSLL